MNSTGTGVVTNRVTPTIWIKQIVLYKSLKPVEEIRSIPFTPGLNIIQGLSNDSTDAFESGHGNGKTTLCRLIRYCLGEKAFGQQHVVAEVKHCFPSGYVGTVIEVDGEQWAVIRPLGSRGGFAKRGVDLSELLVADDAMPFSQFIEQVENIALSSLQRRDVLSGGQSIQWPHLLALCSRDQESRYDRFWNWRHTRSDSGSPKITKNDVSLCVRTILGLLDYEEPRLRGRIAELESELEKLREAIKDKRKEPEYHITRLRTVLKDELGVEEADEAVLEPGHLLGIERAAVEQANVLQARLTETDDKIAPLDRQISMAATQYRELLELQELHEAASEATSDGTAGILYEIDQLRSQHESILERSNLLCPTRMGLVGECEMVKQHVHDLERQLAAKQKESLPDVSRREQIESHLSDQARRQDTPLARLQARLDELNWQKNDLLERRRVVNDLLRRIPLATAEILRWHQIITGEVANNELTSLETDETKKASELAENKKQLSDLVSKQNQRAKQFSKRFHDIVQQTINKSFKGTVVVEDDGLSFRINRERSLAGEAYETLAVLLADLAILQESASTAVCHPGLLIHDSPREADLNIRLYERMLEVAYSLMTDEVGACPYQYIVTTTTPPPKQLLSPKVTKVKLSSGDGSLFKMQLEAGSSDTARQKDLFDTTEET